MKYKVIADFPHTDYKIGDIIDAEPFENNWGVDFKYYPAIFQPLDESHPEQGEQGELYWKKRCEAAEICYDLLNLSVKHRKEYEEWQKLKEQDGKLSSPPPEGQDELWGDVRRLISYVNHYQEMLNEFPDSDWEEDLEKSMNDLKSKYLLIKKADSR